MERGDGKRFLSYGDIQRFDVAPGPTPTAETLRVAATARMHLRPMKAAGRVTYLKPGVTVIDLWPDDA